MKEIEPRKGAILCRIAPFLIIYNAIISLTKKFYCRIIFVKRIRNRHEFSKRER